MDREINERGVAQGGDVAQEGSVAEGVSGSDSEVTLKV